MNALIVIDVHAKDVIANLVKDLKFESIKTAIDKYFEKKTTKWRNCMIQIFIDTVLLFSGLLM